MKDIELINAMRKSALGESKEMICPACLGVDKTELSCSMCAGKGQILKETLIGKLGLEKGE